ncbi:MAG: flagellar biosynthesis anti-sigma factor FlgM [Polyangiaceae bacterium]
MKVHSHAIDAYARTALASTTPARPVEPPATEVTNNSNEAAQVTVSPEARALAAGGGANFDEAKVAQLKKQIEEGEYRVNSQKLAMRILEVIG